MTRKMTVLAFVAAALVMVLVPSGCTKKEGAASDQAKAPDKAPEKMVVGVSASTSFHFPAQGIKR